MDSQNIINEARSSISEFCINECRAYCCRKGYLTLKQAEMELVVQGREEELIQKEILSEIDYGKYSLFLGTPDDPCPSLKDCKCLIHNDLGRPAACGMFPIFVLNKKLLRLSNRCLAVKQGKLYPYVKQLMELGYSVLRSDQGLLL